MMSRHRFAPSVGCVGLAWLGVVCVIAILAARVWQYAAYAAAAIRLPFQLDYGEGIVWQQSVLIPGPAMYGDITRYPYIVFHYPPLYHLVARGVGFLLHDPLAGGRAVSVASLAVTMGLAGWITFSVIRSRVSWQAAILGAAICALSVPLWRPVGVWSVVMRVDLLAMAFSFAGLACGIAAITRPRWLYGAAVAFTLAVFTKQTAIAAPFAVFAVALMYQPRRAIGPILLGAALSLAALAVLMGTTDGRFLRHIVGYNVNRFDPVQAIVHLVLVPLWHPIFVVVALVGAGAMAVERRASVDRAFRQAAAMCSLYLALASAMLITAGKSGASENYFIEWMCLGSVFIGFAFSLAVGRLLAGGEGTTRRVLPVAMLSAGLCWQAYALGLRAVPAMHDPVRQAELTELLSRVRASAKPVLSDDMVLLMQAGKPVPLEPSIFAELSATGMWDERREVDLLRSKAFSFIITQGADTTSRLFEARYGPATIAAMNAAYPVVTDFAGYQIHSPDP